MFYGFVAIIAVGIIYSYRMQMRHRLYLLYGLGGLFVMGLGIRALLVGQMMRASSAPTRSASDNADGARHVAALRRHNDCSRC